ncbi:hypothetical protein [Sphingomonas sp. PP-F2F-G114-C0414]|uniref:hypothetical protein n=1 Tax=Sphingomonas sp. PP-F2F-G114-C0414 TaxID=2135662 RepID=UPI000EF96ADB|nr:hypothetical protein [Sphingomonas sp. PP-F2F-G114-C0414]
MERFLSALAVRNYSPATILDRRHSVATFILWCGERGIERPYEVTKPILERFQRHLYYHRKSNGEPLTFRTQAARMVPLRAWSNGSRARIISRIVSCPTRPPSWSCRVLSGVCRP